MIMPAIFKAFFPLGFVHFAVAGSILTYDGSFIHRNYIRQVLYPNIFG